MTTATHAGRIDLPHMRKTPLKSLLFSLAAIALLTAPLNLAVSQGLPQPKVGGAGTLDAGAGPTGPATQGRRVLSPLSVVPEDFSSLKLSTGFLLSMDVYDAPEMSSNLRIDQAGNVQIPMIGSVHVADSTLVEASTKISDLLRDKKILNDPHVNLDIVEYAGSNITVLGEVRNPGRLELLAPHHLDDVLAMAGGQTELAGRTIEIRHQIGHEPRTEEIRYRHGVTEHILSDTMVAPGDTITVERAGIVYVLGGVTRPGGYVMQEGGNLDVTQALSLAYGTTMNAAVTSMRLIRKLPDGKVEQLPIDYRDMVKGKVPPPQLEAEDVIYVPISKVKTVITEGLVNTAVTAAVIYNR
jgi:polysaccharide export outer membrane protein